MNIQEKIKAQSSLQRELRVAERFMIPHNKNWVEICSSLTQVVREMAKLSRYGFVPNKAQVLRIAALYTVEVLNRAFDLGLDEIAIADKAYELQDTSLSLKKIEVTRRILKDEMGCWVLTSLLEDNLFLPLDEDME